MTMNEIRYHYYKQIKKLKEEAEMKSENIPLNNEQDYLKYIDFFLEKFATPKSERSTIKEGMITQSYGDYYKGIISDLNAVLALARHDLKSYTSELMYDDNTSKELQESINNIQEYKDKLINQYIK